MDFCSSACVNCLESTENGSIQGNQLQWRTVAIPLTRYRRGNVGRGGNEGGMKTAPHGRVLKAALLKFPLLYHGQKYRHSDLHCHSLAKYHAKYINAGG